MSTSDDSALARQQPAQPARPAQPAPLAQPRPRSRRDRPAKAPLSQQAVVEAALAILQADGLEAVTMRRVAAALDTGAASLYVYVPNREGLLQAMLDRVTATVVLEPPDATRWREQLHGLMARVHRALLAHPGTAAIALSDPPSSGSIMQLAENLLGILFAGGFEPEDAAWTCDLLVLVVQAIASEDDVRLRDGGDWSVGAGEFRTRLEALPRERFPLLSTHAAQMVSGDSDERFRFAIDVVLDGVLARATKRR